MSQRCGVVPALAIMRSKVVVLLGLFGLLTAFVGKPVQGANVKVLHQFSLLVTASQTPGSLVQGTDGNFYGLASAGGTNGTGTIFKLSSVGGLTTLHSFGATDYYGNNNDGTSPSVRLVEGTDGSFYGTAFQGGANNTGTIFKITSAGVFTTLASFDQVDPNDTNSSGAYPRAGLTQGSDGGFYGTTSSGGANGNGVIFRITLAGKLTTLYTFNALNPSGGNTDGASPYAALVRGTDGSFYGVTSQGGANGQGTAFKLTLAGTSASLAPLHSFSAVDGNYANSEGAQPLAALIQGKDGNFYGLAESGGTAGQGTFFQLTPVGKVTALHSFSGNEGNSLPAALIQGSNGNFYGVAEAGGDDGDGVVFELTAGGALTPLHDFDGADGQGPAAALVQDKAGNLYGVASAGGVYNEGTFFKLAPNGSFAKLSDFGLVSNTDGAHSDAPLVLGKDGKFYGTTNNGGMNGNGTIFKVTRAGVITVLHSFSAEDDNLANDDGALPNGGLVQGNDGNFYGTASAGGANATGTIFKITPAGVFTSLSSFDPLDEQSNNQSGAYPFAALFEGKDGNFYGTAPAGGAYSNGTAFKVTPTGSLTILYTFGAVDDADTNADGASPNAGLVEGKDGNFYGMAQYGGANDTGTIFKLTPAGGFTTLDSFDALDDGNYNPSGALPIKALIQGTDGSFYGTAGYGGPNAAGTAFKVTSTGKMTILHAFGTVDANYENTDGVAPEASLVQGTNGKFYGTTVRGSTNEGGTIFELTSGGDLTTLYSFGNGGSGAGANSDASLVQGKTAGLLFGTTSSGGNGAGTIFRIALLPNITAPLLAKP